MKVFIELEDGASIGMVWDKWGDPTLVIAGQKVTMTPNEWDQVIETMKACRTVRAA